MARYVLVVYQIPFLNLDNEVIPILLSAVDDSNEVPHEKNICADDKKNILIYIDSNDGDFDFQELPQKNGKQQQVHFSGVFEGHKRYVVHCKKCGGPLLTDI